MKLFHTGATGNEELRNYFPVSVNLSIENLAPYIGKVEERFIVDILGQAEFDNLAEAFEDDTMDAAQEAILPICQRAIANLGYLAYMPIGNAYFSDYGILVGQTDKTAPASQWRLRDIRNSFAYEGFTALEDLLIFLWASEEDSYPDWEVSDNRAKHRDTVILSAREFNNYFWIDDSYQLFRMMKPTLRNVQRYYIRPVLGDDLYEEILTQIREDALSEGNAFLLQEYIAPAAALFTFFEAAPRLRLDIGEFGITQRQTSDKLTEDVHKPATDIAYGDGILSAESRGQTFIADLREYLYANHASFPLYEASPQYAQRQAEADRNDENGDPINDPDSKVVGFF